MSKGIVSGQRKTFKNMFKPIIFKYNCMAFAGWPRVFGQPPELARLHEERRIECIHFLQRRPGTARLSGVRTWPSTENVEFSGVAK